MGDNIKACFKVNNPKIKTCFQVNDTKLGACFKLNVIPTITGSDLIGVDRSISGVTITSKTYTHEQGIASDTWEINHNLNKYPSVTLVDTAGTQFQGRVEYTDENNCIVYMNGATKGKAYLN